MSKNHHIPYLPLKLREYTDSRKLDFDRYSEFHMRIMDGGYTVLDIWTTGRYYVKTTDYLELYPEGKLVERNGEKGQLDMENYETWLDKLFFPEAE